MGMKKKEEGRRGMVSGSLLVVACLVVAMSIILLSSSVSAQVKQHQQAVSSELRSEFRAVESEQEAAQIRRAAAEKIKQIRVGESPLPSESSLCGITGLPSTPANLTCYVLATGEFIYNPVVYFEDDIWIAPGAVSSSVNSFGSHAAVLLNGRTGLPMFVEIGNNYYMGMYLPNNIQNAENIHGIGMFATDSYQTNTLYFLNLGKQLYPLFILFTTNHSTFRDE